MGGYLSTCTGSLNSIIVILSYLVVVPTGFIQFWKAVCPYFGEDRTALCYCVFEELLFLELLLLHLPLK